jgi:iron-sulfur cluster assembly protein
MVVWTSHNAIGKASMLTLTENATAIVNEITHQPGLDESAGLRITSPSTPDPAFEVTAAAQGEPGDQVVEQGGATIYLDETAATMLDDKVLDAAVDPSGKVEFALALQG